MPAWKQAVKENAPDKGLAETVDPVHEAIKAGELTKLRALMPSVSAVNMPDGHGTTPLMFAAALGRLSCVKELMRMGADIHATKPGDGFTALMYAALGGKSLCVEMLIAMGARVDVKSSGGSAPLHFAIRKRHLECVEALLECGADPSQITGDHLDAVGYANKLDLPEIASSISAFAGRRSSGALAESQSTTDLLRAAREGDEASVRAAISRREDIDAAGSLGRTGLMEAALYGQAAIVDSLANASCDVNATDSRYGMTPLMFASCSDSPNSIQFLLAHGANLETKSNVGLTALLYAVRESAPSAVGTLLTLGAESSATTEDGLSAIQYAEKLGHRNIVSMLKTGATVMPHSNNGHECRNCNASISGRARQCPNCGILFPTSVPQSGSTGSIAPTTPWNSNGTSGVVDTPMTRPIMTSTPTSTNSGAGGCSWWWILPLLWALHNVGSCGTNNPANTTNSSSYNQSSGGYTSDGGNTN